MQVIRNLILALPYVAAYSVYTGFYRPPRDKDEKFFLFF